MSYLEFTVLLYLIISYKYSQQQILKTENQTALKAKMDAILTPLLQSQ